MWIEIQLNHTRILFCLFYRPPNSDMSYYSSIEDSISLAMDTQINNNIITGDFKLDMLSHQTARKVSELCEQFSLSQTITEPTHYTEHSSSLIGLILTSDKGNLIYSGVAEPFLHQDMRYHYPVYGVFKYSDFKEIIHTPHLELRQRRLRPVKKQNFRYRLGFAFRSRCQCPCY